MSIFWAYVKFRIAVAVLRLAGRVFLWALSVAVLVAAAPITLVAATGLAGAWLRGWPPSRLWRAVAARQGAARKMAGRRRIRLVSWSGD
jgi:hypothetical protein